jgi:YrbI family 3-deoxy-D-manno-octulosonate 8-phosphate phosphatase
MRNKTVAFIPVRGGSKSIPLKNIKEIAGKPLVQWVIEAAVEVKLIEAVYVATDSDAIKRCVEQLSIDKVHIISRSPESATDTASSESVLMEFCENYEFNDVVFIQATSPLLKTQDLDEALVAYKNRNCDTMLSVVRQKRFIWDDKLKIPLNYDLLKRPRRQEFNGYLVENGAFYISSREAVLENECRISGKIELFEMSEDSYIELDEPFDWKIVEQLLVERKREGLKERLAKIKMVVMDVDGVLTDGGMYYSENGDELKKFNTRDGMAIQQLRKEGCQTAIITGENCELVRKRAEKLKIDYLFMGIKDKGLQIDKLSELSGVNPSEMAYIGDDVNDIPAITKCGVSFCPSDSVDEVKSLADCILEKKGGYGVLQKLKELLIKDGW